jgi:2-C-methyl-D-erythritol 4-phosphate cytidylyltransferase/2-C-methyl-D-erythritol 2,4-cyclodiphosphate synthase
LTKASALIAAAGAGERLGKGINKAFVEVAGKPILAHTLSVFESCKAVGEIIIITGEPDIEAAGELVGRFGFSKVSGIVAGGVQRQDSVRNGLDAATGDIVAIHDAARPMVTVELIERSIEKAAEMGACVAAVPVIDTIKSARGDDVVSTVDRSELYSVQTPQTFRAELIRRAYERAYADGYYATDDAALVERLGDRVAVVVGSYDNIKVTTPSDLEIAQVKLGGGFMDETRVGIGFDVHAFAENRKLMLGGVEIEYESGLAGHSDADVVLHAIADALLGAAALGDIGRHFPDSDPAYKGISSLNLLSEVNHIIAQAGWCVVNVDATVICERPKISTYVPEMRQMIARALNASPDRISIKGTTTERLGFTGRGEGIACQAVGTLRKA